MDITMRAMEKMRHSPHMMNKDVTHKVLSAQGESHFMMVPSQFPPDNPMTAKGEKVMGSMVKQYGAKKGKKVFYSSANKGRIKGVHKK